MNASGNRGRPVSVEKPRPLATPTPLAPPLGAPPGRPRVPARGSDGVEGAREPSRGPPPRQRLAAGGHAGPAPITPASSGSRGGSTRRWVLARGAGCFPLGAEASIRLTSSPLGRFPPWGTRRAPAVERHAQRTTGRAHAGGESSDERRPRAAAAASADDALTLRASRRKSTTTRDDATLRSAELPTTGSMIDHHSEAAAAPTRGTTARCVRLR